MRRFAYETFDVFTSTRFGGNQLAVFPDARGISDAEMQLLAAEFNYSETTFVLPPADPANTARVRIFHRTAEMPFAGHPNVGTGFALAGRAQGDVLRFEQIAGLVEVVLRRDAAGRPTGATIGAPQPLQVGGQVTQAEAAACAGLNAADVVLARHAPTIAADGGNPRLLLEVTPAALARATPELAAFRSTVEAYPELDGKLSLYLYVREPSCLRARMFSPLAGTPEDPATGSAATPLAGFLLRLEGGESADYEIHQGVEMGRPSLLLASARRGPDGIRARVGGGCVAVMQGSVQLD
jgi:trans-2,3-dihydro-3-hydroxyanthranilate isomerase